MNKFSKKESEFCKGIGILMMIFHHLFYKAENYQEYVITFSPFTEERINFFALLCKVCVAIFVFISGYGIAASYRKEFSTHAPNAGKITDFIKKRIMKLYSLYWFVFVLTVLCQPLGRTISEAYGPELKSQAVYFLLDFLGLSYMFGTPTLNPTWWYITLALLIIVSVPLIEILYKKVGVFPAIAAVMGILFLFSASNANTFYIFSILIGAGCCEGAFFEKLDADFHKIKYGKILKCIIEIVCLLIGVSLRTNYNYYGIIDGIIVVCLAALTGDLLIKIPVVSNSMRILGRHSGNMFLVHNQIYSYYFVSLIYGCKHWILILLMLVLTSFVTSVVIEKTKKLVHYSKLFSV